MPKLAVKGLRPAQVEVVSGVERSPAGAAIRAVAGAGGHRRRLQAAAVAAAPVVDGVVDDSAAVQALLDDAVSALAANPALRQRILAE